MLRTHNISQTNITEVYIIWPCKLKGTDKHLAMHKPLGYHKSRSWRLYNHLCIVWLIWSKIESKKLPSLAIFVGKSAKNMYLAILYALFGMLKWPFQGLSDLQLGDEKGTLNHLVYRIQSLQGLDVETGKKKPNGLTCSQIEEITKTLKKLHPWKLTCPLKVTIPVGNTSSTIDF